MEEIESYERIGGLKNEISNLVMQKYAIDQICAQRNKAITSLVKLQSFGVTDEKIFNIHEFLNGSRLGNVKRTMHGHPDSLMFSSYDLNSKNGAEIMP
jgi:hypothetical protein